MNGRRVFTPTAPTCFLSYPCPLPLSLAWYYSDLNTKFNMESGNRGTYTYNSNTHLLRQGGSPRAVGRILVNMDEDMLSRENANRSWLWRLGSKTGHNHEAAMPACLLPYPKKLFYLPQS